jgi:hypothetical protein
MNTRRHIRSASQSRRVIFDLFKDLVEITSSTEHHILVGLTKVTMELSDRGVRLAKLLVHKEAGQPVGLRRPAGRLLRIPPMPATYSR